MITVHIVHILLSRIAKGSNFFLTTPKHVYTGRKEIRTEIFLEGNAMGDQFLTSYKFKQTVSSNW